MKAYDGTNRNQFWGDDGQPVIRGTRIPVELIVRKLSEGATEVELLDAYPRLIVEDIQHVLHSGLQQRPFILAVRSRQWGDWTLLLRQYLIIQGSF